MLAQPLCPPIPGLQVALADDFIVFPNQLWHCGRDSTPDTSKQAWGFDGPKEAEVFLREGVRHLPSVVALTASYTPDVAPAEGKYPVRNYTSGCMTTAPVGATKHGFLWTPGQGDAWVFQIRCKFPPNVDNCFWPAFWSAGPVDGWENEMDFFEGLSGWGIDTDHIYQTQPKLQEWYDAVLGFDPSAAFHTYDYVVYADQTWQFYVDEALQTWVGNKGTAPARQSVDVPMQVICNLSVLVDAATWTEGTYALEIDHVGVWSTGHYYQGGGIAPGTVLQ